MLSQILVNGLIAGAIYALVAVGFSLVYSTNRFAHFAQGTALTIGAYALYQFFTVLKIDFWVSCLLAILFTSLIGFGMERFVYQPLREKKASYSILLLASFALLILIEAIILLLFGADVKTIPLFPIEKGIELLGFIITPLQVIIIFITVLLFVLLAFFLTKTKTGQSLRAVADNPALAEIHGISTKRVFSLTMVLSSALGAVAGILVGLEQNLEPTMGTSLIIKGFAGAIIGGLTSVPGAIVGSFLLGIIENVGIWFLPSGYKDAIAFTLLFLFLIFKPQGLFGVKGE